jgi:chromosome segregation ATPase
LTTSDTSVSSTLVANSESTEARIDTSVKELQESLIKNAELTNTIIGLRNELAVANSKVNSLEENINNYREVAKQLSRLDKVKCNLDERCKKLQENFKTLRTNHGTLVEKFNETEDAKVKLEESLNNLKTDFEQKMEQSKTLEEKYKSRIQFYRDKVDRLVESLNKKQEVQHIETSDSALTESINASNLANKELTAKNQQLTEALNEANSRANINSKKLDKAISKYLEVKSIMTGVDAKEVERRLPKEYTFEDIDGLYESLQFNKDTIVLEKVDVHSMRKNNLEPRNADEEEFQDFVMGI